MKLTAFWSLLGLVASPRAISAAAIVNHGAPGALLVPDRYIVMYKPEAPLHQRKDHEDEFHSRAKRGSMRGLINRFDIPGLQGYVIEISSSELKALVKSECVGSTKASTAGDGGS